jgi:hypothetical protein
MTASIVPKGYPPLNISITNEISKVPNEEPRTGWIHGPILPDL